MIVNFIMYTHYLMPISNDCKFYYVYAPSIFIFGGEPCHIVVLRGLVSQKGA